MTVKARKRRETKNCQKLLWILDFFFPKKLVPFKVISTIITGSSLNQLLSLKSSGLFCHLFFSASVCLFPKLLTPAADQEARLRKNVSSFYHSCKNFLFSTTCYAACGKTIVWAWNPFEKEKKNLPSVWISLAGHEEHVVRRSWWIF